MTVAPASAVHMQVTARKLLDSDFYLALETLRSEAGGPADTGRRFERLMRRAFATHPYEYGPERFENVWLWSDCPTQSVGYGADIGIDSWRSRLRYGGGLLRYPVQELRRDHRCPPAGRLVPRSLGSAHFLSRSWWCPQIWNSGWTKVKKASPRWRFSAGASVFMERAGRDFLDRPDEFTSQIRGTSTAPISETASTRWPKGYQQGSRGRLVMARRYGSVLALRWLRITCAPSEGAFCVSGGRRPRLFAAGTSPTGLPVCAVPVSASAALV